MLTMTNSTSQQFSNSTSGNEPLSNDNGFYDLLLSCWIKLGIGGEDRMEIMLQDDDAPGGYIPAWLSGLSSCSSIVVIKGSYVYAIV